MALCVRIKVYQVFSGFHFQNVYSDLIAWADVKISENQNRHDFLSDWTRGYRTLPKRLWVGTELEPPTCFT